MTTRIHKNFVLAFSLPLAALIGIAGLLMPLLYEKETADWVSQSTSQDAVNLFLVLYSTRIVNVLRKRGLAFSMLLY